MHMYRLLAILALVLPAIAALASDPPPSREAAMQAHVTVLASDTMRGRAAGSPEFEAAARYVAAQFRSMGLKPGGDAGGYLQRVPMVRYLSADGGKAIWTPADGTAQLLRFGDDYVPFANPAAVQTRVSAPVIFVGYGVDAPRSGHNDYAGLDVRGKIVAIVGGLPPALTGDERTYWSWSSAKVDAAARHGAVGLVGIHNPALNPVIAPLRIVAPSRNLVNTSWSNPDGTGGMRGPIPFLADLSPEMAARLFGDRWPGITAEAAKDKPRYTPLAARGALSITLNTRFTPMASSNVIGLVPGRDPRLRREVIVLTAHLDHVAPLTFGQGDRINNGALDNAVGVATLIDVARQLARAPARRTVMILVTTGEEAGKIGSEWFIHRPTVPLRSIIANINVDMPILLYRFEDVVAYGTERSSLIAPAQAAATAVGARLSLDPAPERGTFFRSDHISFVRRGIPAVFVQPGWAGPGKAAIGRFLRDCYHQPCDSIVQQPILWDQGVRYADLIRHLTREVADAAARPTWNRGDYLAERYRPAKER